MRVTLGAPGRIMPPADRAVELARRAEADGFDAIWWPCHLMGWIPDSAWTQDMTELARYQDSPHVHLDPLIMMGAAGAATSTIRVGVCVTDTIRRHPAMLAQAALTVDHLARGRAIVGLGSGERMNITPYGMEWSKPVGRLEEAVQVIRLLWSTDPPVDFDGRFFKLRDAVLGLRPLDGRPPPVWLAAPMTRMLFAAVDLPQATYERHGSTSPFQGGTGFHSFLPSTVTREEVERIVSHIPAGIVREHTLCGTPAQIVEQIRAYEQAGLRDVILWNITPFADPAQSAYSFKAMAQVRELLDGEG